MKRLALALLAIGLGVLSEAQETYSIPGSAPNVVTLSDVITYYNGQKCEAQSLPRACTQAQACTAAGAPGGASCTAAQARGANVRIFPLTQPGREEYVTFEIAAPKFGELVTQVQAGAKRRDYCEAWASASQGTRDTHCSALGLPTGPSGCTPCQ